MPLPSFTARGGQFAHLSLGRPVEGSVPHVIWGHGWGMTHASLAPIARSLERQAHHTILDFPGFGESPVPATPWSNLDYADALAEWLETLPRGRRIFVGHSFGGRVALRLAAQHPSLIDALVIAGGAGLQRQRSFLESVRVQAKIRSFKALKGLERLGFDMSKYKAGFGSADYRNAGAMRPIFVAVVGEDQTESVKRISCPVTLLYGENDNETPPEIGKRLSALIPRASFRVLPGLDHYSILTDGAPQIANAVAGALEMPA